VANTPTVIETLPPTSGRALTPFSGRKQVGGGLDGAATLNRDTALWNAPTLTADVEVQRSKRTANARSLDQIKNNGYMAGGVETYKDSVIGAWFKLNLKPDFKFLGLDEVWAKEFKQFVETRWNLYAESHAHYVDAARRMTATELIRVGLGSYIGQGDTLYSSEWLPKAGNPYRTAFKLVDVNRISNPNGTDNTSLLRDGIVINRHGAIQSIWLRTAYANSPYRDLNNNTWREIPAEKPWGRKMMLYYADTRRPEQTRAISRLVIAMREMRMLEKYQDVVLQNAILNATYAAVIESELPRDIVYAQLGEMGTSSTGSPLGAGPLIDYMKLFLSAASDYQGGGKNLALDGVKMPHLLPGTKLNLQNAGDPGGVGTNFEASFLRHFSRAIGISHEEFSGDFASTNYSGAKASMATTERTMRSVKRTFAESAASDMLSNWLEEELNSEGTNAPMPRNAPSWYEGMNKVAYTQAQWIGSSRGQLNELQETQAALLRMNAGISTREKEAARLGEDWVEVAEQRAREAELDKKLGLSEPVTDTKKDAAKQSTQTKQAKRIRH
jgi:phage portal protein, lambda family